MEDFIATTDCISIATTNDCNGGLAVLLNMQDSTATHIGLHRSYYCGLVCYCDLYCYFYRSASLHMERRVAVLSDRMSENTLLAREFRSSTWTWRMDDKLHEEARRLPLL